MSAARAEDQSARGERRYQERWIADPNALVPGNKMIVQLANDPTERAAIVAYLVATTRATR